MLKLPATLLEFFPQVIQISQPLNIEELNADLLAAIDQICQTTPNSKPHHWAGNLYTTAHNENQLMHNPKFKELTKFISKEVQSFAEAHKVEVKNKYNKVLISNMWINKYKYKYSMDQHCHPNSIFTGVYFVKAPNGSGLLAFDSPSSEQMVLPPVKIKNAYNMRQVGFNMSEGDLVIFNSYLKHRVLLHEIKEERISIGFTCTL